MRQGIREKVKKKLGDMRFINFILQKVMNKKFIYHVILNYYINVLIVEYSSYFYYRKVKLILFNKKLA